MEQERCSLNVSKKVFGYTDPTLGSLLPKSESFNQCEWMVMTFFIFLEGEGDPLPLMYLEIEPKVLHVVRKHFTTQLYL